MERKLTFKQPLKLSYSDFMFDKDKKVECVYKITFSDGKYYIGRTTNFFSRIYNHITMLDAKNANRLAEKHKRMKLAIDNYEEVIFEIIDKNPSKEKMYLELNINNENCLNEKPW